MTLRQREPRRHDAAHLIYVRQQPCCVCLKPAPSEAAHLRMRRPDIDKDNGLGEKPHDQFVTPLCPRCHRDGPLAQHHIGEDEFWLMAALDPWAIAARLWIESGGAARASEPRPIKKPRQVAARKPRDKRKKIAGRTEIQTRGFEKRSPQLAASGVRT